jgi:6-phosphogluconolactonase
MGATSIMPTRLNVTTHSFTDCRTQAFALAERVAEALRAAIGERGHALLAVSGGSTPKAFFDVLSQQTLDWARVQVTLVDERWVAETDPRSNARLVKSSLLQHAASAATFVPLYCAAPTPEDGLAATRERIAALSLPFDAVVLGMGDDGHTASFFPGGDHLIEALDLHGQARVLPMRAPGAGEPRITLTLAALLQTRSLFLLVSGESKRQLLADARLGLGEARHYPVRAVLTQPCVPVSVYWCPNASAATPAT